METTALTDNKLVMYTSEQVQQVLDMVVRIPSIRVGKKIVISRQAVLDWLKEGD